MLFSQDERKHICRPLHWQLFNPGPPPPDSDGF